MWMPILLLATVSYSLPAPPSACLGTHEAGEEFVYVDRALVQGRPTVVLALLDGVLRDPDSSPGACEEAVRRLWRRTHGPGRLMADEPLLVGRSLYDLPIRVVPSELRPWAHMHRGAWAQELGDETRARREAWGAGALPARWSEARLRRCIARVVATSKDDCFAQFEDPSTPLRVRALARAGRARHRYGIRAYDEAELAYRGAIALLPPGDTHRRALEVELGWSLVMQEGGVRRAHELSLRLADRPGRHWLEASRLAGVAASLWVLEVRDQCTEEGPEPRDDAAAVRYFEDLAEQLEARRPSRQYPSIEVHRAGRTEGAVRRDPRVRALARRVDGLRRQTRPPWWSAWLEDALVADEAALQTALEEATEQLRADFDAVQGSLAILQFEHRGSDGYREGPPCPRSAPRLSP